ncbi:cAMP-binding protein [Clostridium botulinum C/D str. BKT12695]|nr:cAMP-binding protein [Clostridium botulinum C/D str. BKT12695]
MDNLINSLNLCFLFNNFENDDILKIINSINYKVTSYEKGETIAIEGDPIHSIGLVLDGCVEVQKNYSSGKIVSINRIKRGNVFGEAIIFSNKNTYPSTIVAFENSEVFFISKKNILSMCASNTLFLNNFMRLLSNRILKLNKILRDISYETIRAKLCNFILNEYKIQKSMKIKLSSSRQEMADSFGITRPSLSRELANMKNDGLIDFEKKFITILDLEEIENVLLNS